MSIALQDTRVEIRGETTSDDQMNRPVLSQLSYPLIFTESGRNCVRCVYVFALVHTVFRPTCFATCMLFKSVLLDTMSISTRCLHTITVFSRHENVYGRHIIVLQLPNDKLLTTAYILLTTLYITNCVYSSVISHMRVAHRKPNINHNTIIVDDIDWRTAIWPTRIVLALQETSEVWSLRRNMVAQLWHH